MPQIKSIDDIYLFYTSIFFSAMYSVPPANNENFSQRNLWQRLYARRQNQKSNEASSLRSLVTKQTISFISISFGLCIYFQFRFANLIDLLYLTFGSIGALALGVTLPLSMVIFGDSIDAFIDRSTNLCSLNLTSLSELYCPPGTILTTTNFYISIS